MFFFLASYIRLGIVHEVPYKFRFYENHNNHQHFAYKVFFDLYMNYILQSHKNGQTFYTTSNLETIVANKKSVTIFIINTINHLLLLLLLQTALKKNSIDGYD